MDLADVKDLIKSLIASADGGCSIQQLLIEFEQETGLELPYFNFYNPRDFLLTLTDIIKVVNTTSGEWTVLIDPNNVENDAAAYVARQSHPPRTKDDRPDFSTRNTRFENEVERYDINSFIRAYQMGWVTLNEFGEWARVKSINGIPPADGMRAIEETDFLFREDELDGLEDTTRRRAAVKLFLQSIDSVKDPEWTVAGTNVGYPLAYHSASEEFRRSLQNVMPEGGIWLKELPALFSRTYGSALECKDHGYRSLMEMVRSLKDVFRCMKPFRNEVYLFKASVAPDSDEEEMYDRAFYELPEKVIMFIINLVENYCETTSEPGIPRDEFLGLYYKKYRLKLDYVKYGFPDFRTMLSRLNGKILKIEEFGRVVIIKPLIERSRLVKRTIFSLTPDDSDVYSELFPIDCIGYGVKFRAMKPQCYFKLGRRVRVNVSDALFPDKFYIQLKIFEKELNDLMKEMLYFYKYRENDYRMPEATIRPDQICAAMYNNDGLIEWHRSIITSVPDRRHVVVFLVDYGVRVTLDKEKIRFLHQKFYPLPRQGFSGRVHNIKPLIKGPWPLNVNTRFLDLISCKDILFRAMRYDLGAERLLGELFIYEDHRQVSVGSKLYREGLVDRRLDDREPFPSSDDETNRVEDHGESDDYVNYYNSNYEEEDDENEDDEDDEDEEDDEHDDDEDEGDEDDNDDDEDDDEDDDGDDDEDDGDHDDDESDNSEDDDDDDDDDDDNLGEPFMVRNYEMRLVPASQSLVPLQRHGHQAQNPEARYNARGRDEVRNENPFRREQRNAAPWEEMLPEYRGVTNRPDDPYREVRLRDEWTLEKEISALAFYLLSTTRWLQDIAQNDMENGLFVARTLAEKLIELE